MSGLPDIGTLVRKSAIADLRGRRSNPEFPELEALDCFAEPVIGPATSGRARWLAMTDQSNRDQLWLAAAQPIGRRVW